MTRTSVRRHLRRTASGRTDVRKHTRQLSSDQRGISAAKDDIDRQKDRRMSENTGSAENISKYYGIPATEESAMRQLNHLVGLNESAYETGEFGGYDGKKKGYFTIVEKSSTSEGRPIKIYPIYYSKKPLKNVKKVIAIRFNRSDYKIG